MNYNVGNTAYFILKLSICINTICNSQIRSTGTGSDLVDVSLMEPTATDSMAAPVMTAPDPVLAAPVMSVPVMTAPNPILAAPVMSVPVMTAPDPVFAAPVMTAPVMTAPDPVLSGPVMSVPVMTAPDPVLAVPVVSVPAMTAPNPLLAAPVMTASVAINRVVPMVKCNIWRNVRSRELAVCTTNRIWAV